MNLSLPDALKFDTSAMDEDFRNAVRRNEERFIGFPALGGLRRKSAILSRPQEEHRFVIVNHHVHLAPTCVRDDKATLTTPMRNGLQPLDGMGFHLRIPVAKVSGDRHAVFLGVGVMVDKRTLDETGGVGIELGEGFINSRPQATRSRNHVDSEGLLMLLD